MRHISHINIYQVIKMNNEEMLVVIFLVLFAFLWIYIMILYCNYENINIIMEMKKDCNQIKAIDDSTI